VSDDREIVRGEVSQLLRPDEVDDYAVGEIGELFGAHGWAIAVVSDSPPTGSPVESFRRLVLSLSPINKPPHVTDVFVRNPDFREGDTVRLACEKLDDHWFVHPENPLETREVER
jgi:hypothetical protein